MVSCGWPQNLEGGIEMRSFHDLSRAKWAEGKLLCVGLDPDYGKFSEAMRLSTPANSVLTFGRSIVEATADIVGCYKPNMAFYEKLGYNGWVTLRETIEHIRGFAPTVPVILDFKRGDIGNTNAGYVEEAFDFFEADAVTVHPYLGQEAMQPFLDRKEKGIFVLCRTSNPGAGEFQDLKVEVMPEAFDEIVQTQPATSDGFSIPKHIPLYQYVAHKVRVWNRSNKNCGVVAGATYPDELKQVRNIVGDMPILIPGGGAAQGGDVAQSVRAGKDSRGQGIFVSLSRDIIFASREAGYAETARIKAKEIDAEIRKAAA
jgi:orotidine-5'-phosphate decarboxylase